MSIFHLLYANAVMPSRATKGSAGYDFHAMTDGNIKPGGMMLVQTGVAWSAEVAATSRLVGILKSRSSLAIRNLSVEGGVVDQDYDGEIKIILRNHGKEDFAFKAGDKLAQMILTQYCHMYDEEFDSERDGGFGSTDIVKE